ncbi:MAG: NAD-dependent deacylase [Paracoccus sp. (in: a-proteobacteria)]|jgi:NAD-dependent deacetylase
MRITVLTGAGISAESGIRTFRATDGLWEEHRIEDVATPEGFRRDPVLVHRFYNMRRADAARARPNAAHKALARLAKSHDVTLITQNVDDLHERGGSPEVIHMHGSLLGALCANCGHRWPATLVMRSLDPCPSCGKPATRPDIVWFGEIPYHMDRIWKAVEDADIFAAIGTSGQVYPAAGLAQHARRNGAETVELNLVPSAVSGDFTDMRAGPATRVVPEWVAELC